MTCVFISYRQSDALDVTDQLEHKLSQALPAVHIFRDVSDIEPAENWLEKITQAIRGADLMLVLIGPEWLTVEKRGLRRLDDPDDIVRREVALGLAENVPIIPALVHGARFPEAEDLPEELQPLAWINAHAIHPRTFDKDLDALVKRIGQMLKITIRERPSKKAQKTISTLMNELDDLVEKDPDVENFDAYWRWWLGAKETLRDSATGTQVLNDIKRLDLLLSEAQEDEMTLQLSILELAETLPVIRRYFSTEKVLAEDEPRETPGDSAIRILPGIPLKNFGIRGSWQCEVTGPSVRYTYNFCVRDDGTVTGTYQGSGGQGTIDGKQGFSIWEPPKEDRYIGERPTQVVGVRIEGLADSRQRFNLVIPIDEKLGNGYAGTDDQGWTYFLRKV